MVIEVGTNRKPVCDFLLAINSNWHPIPYRSELSQLIVQILDTSRFWATLWGLRHSVRCSSWTHWKARSGLPISVNWTFFARCYGWGAASENRSKIDQFDLKFQEEEVAPSPIIFARIVRPMNALQLRRWHFYTKKLCSIGNANGVL